MQAVIRLVALGDAIPVEVREQFGLRSWLLWDASQDADDGAHEVVWVTPDKRTSVHLFKDARTSLDYFSVRGDKAIEVAEQLAASDLAVGPGAARETYDAATSKRDLVAAIDRLLLTHTDVVDHHHVERFEAALAHGESAVRAAALQALARIHWAEAKELIERTASGHAHATTRTLAAGLLAELAKHTD